MHIGKVTGTLVATVREETYEYHKLLFVDRLGLDGQAQEHFWIAVATVQAGIGDTVLVIDEGNSARQVVGKEPDGAIRAVIVGIVDEVDLWG